MLEIQKEKHYHNSVAEPLSLSFKADLDAIGKPSREVKVSLSIITILLAVILVLCKSYYFAGIIVLGVVAFLLEPPPKRKMVRLTQREIHLGEKRFSYHDFKSFWVSEGKKNILFLEPVGFYLLPVALVISGYDASEIKEFLSKHLPERAYDSERMIVFLERLFGIR